MKTFSEWLLNPIQYNRIQESTDISSMYVQVLTTEVSYNQTEDNDPEQYYMLDILVSDNESEIRGQIPDAIKEIEKVLGKKHRAKYKGDYDPQFEHRLTPLYKLRGAEGVEILKSSENFSDDLVVLHLSGVKEYEDDADGFDRYKRTLGYGIPKIEQSGNTYKLTFSKKLGVLQTPQMVVDKSDWFYVLEGTPDFIKMLNAIFGMYRTTQSYISKLPQLKL